MALFIGRLPADATSRDLEEVFSKYGKISRCDIKKGFGFVQFEDKRDAEEAVAEADGKRVLGSPIVVEWAKNGGQKPVQSQCFRCGKDGHWARDCRSSGSYGGDRERRRSRSPGRDRRDYERRDYERRDYDRRDYDRRDDRRDDRRERGSDWRDDRRGDRDRSPGRSYRSDRGAQPARRDRSPPRQRDRSWDRDQNRRTAEPTPARERDRESRDRAPELPPNTDWETKQGWDDNGADAPKTEDGW